MRDYIDLARRPYFYFWRLHIPSPQGQTVVGDEKRKVSSKVSNENSQPTNQTTNQTNQPVKKNKTPSGPGGKVGGD
jgi:hypothetical protein